MPVVTLKGAFEQFLEGSSFARRTRESYSEDLAPLFAAYGQAPIPALTIEVVQAFLARQESLAPATYNRRLAALRSFIRWLRTQGWQIEEILEKVERKPEGKQIPRALDAQRVESVLRQITDPRDRTLFWLIYDGGLRCQEALAIDIEDISWPDRSILIQGKGDRPREIFFSRAVSTLLDKYLITRGNPTTGPLFVTQRKARLPRRADLTPDGYARLSYRQADTLWKQYTPGWDLHQLRHTAISVRAAHEYTEVDLKRFSGHTSLRSLERYIADNREAAKRKARAWERRQG
ncbi:MAG: tyrosine-type recombinase/integrase [Ktedonobacteraceae bacterium]